MAENRLAGREAEVAVDHALGTLKESLLGGKPLRSGGHTQSSTNGFGGKATQAGALGYWTDQTESPSESYSQSTNSPASVRLMSSYGHSSRSGGSLVELYVHPKQVKRICGFDVIRHLSKPASKALFQQGVSTIPPYLCRLNELGPWLPITEDDYHQSLTALDFVMERKQLRRTSISKAARQARYKSNSHRQQHQPHPTDMRNVQPLYAQQRVQQQHSFPNSIKRLSTEDLMPKATKQKRKKSNRSNPKNEHRAPDSEESSSVDASFLVRPKLTPIHTPWHPQQHDLYYETPPDRVAYPTSVTSRTGMDPPGSRQHKELSRQQQLDMLQPQSQGMMQHQQYQHSPMYSNQLPPITPQRQLDMEQSHSFPMQQHSSRQSPRYSRQLPPPTPKTQFTRHPVTRNLTPAMHHRHGLGGPIGLGPVRRVSEIGWTEEEEAQTARRIQAALPSSRAQSPNPSNRSMQQRKNYEKRKASATGNHGAPGKEADNQLLGLMAATVVKRSSAYSETISISSEDGSDNHEGLNESETGSASENSEIASTSGRPNYRAAEVPSHKSSRQGSNGGVADSIRHERQRRKTVFCRRWPLQLNRLHGELV